jgi:hypothetical protein
MKELPELHETVLDEATVDRLFTDIAELTRVIEVIPKASGRGYVGEQSITLQAARQMLRSRGCRAIQVRYVHDGAQWWDTLMPQPKGTRIVRIRHDPNDHA